jgi:VanZ family protein
MALGKLPLPIRFLLFLLTCTLLVWVSSYSPDTPSDMWYVPWFHQMAHAPLFGIFALSFLILLGSEAPTKGIAWMTAFLLVLLAGTADEWHQSVVPGRASDIHDIFTDLLGGLGAILLARWANQVPLRWGAGIRLLALLFVVLAAWGWYSYDAEPWPLPWLTT